MTYAELLTIRERIDGHQYDSDDVTQRTIDAMMAEDVLPQAPCRELLRMVADETVTRCENCGVEVCQECNTFGRCPACHRLKMRKRREYEEA